VSNKLKEQHARVLNLHRDRAPIGVTATLQYWHAAEDRMTDMAIEVLKLQVRLANLEDALFDEQPG
jgi:hypothetical protein